MKITLKIKNSKIVSKKKLVLTDLYHDQTGVIL